MKTLMIIRLVLISSSLFSQDKSSPSAGAGQRSEDSPSLELSGSIQVASNGISPVPAFSLGKPAIMTNLVLKKTRFSFTNQFNYGIDGKPWSSNNWFRFELPRGKFLFRIGTNWSFYFKESTIIENNQAITIKRVNRYSENELAIIYRVNARVSIQTMWWHDEGLDVDAVKRGDFYSVSTEIAQIPLFEGVSVKVRPHLFYTENKIPFRGLFIANTATFNYKELPLSISVQLVQPLVVKPEGAFSWNIGLIYSFKN